MGVCPRTRRAGARPGGAHSSISVRRSNCASAVRAARARLFSVLSLCTPACCALSAVAPAERVIERAPWPDAPVARWHGQAARSAARRNRKRCNAVAPCTCT
eukprot:6186590-Pleurochrysis_carterae.AAC.3